MKVLTQIAQKINNPQNNKIDEKIEVKSSPEILEELKTINNNEILILLKELFPNGIVPNRNVYKVLKDYQMKIGYGQLQDNLIGKLWINIYNSIPNNDKIELLRCLEDIDTMEFWEMVKVFTVFLSEINVDPEFASKWFLHIAKKIENDLAGGEFYNGILKYSYNFPISGLYIFNKYLKNLGDNTSHNLAAIILGTVRASEFLTDDLRQEIKKIDSTLRNSLNESYRLCFYRSLVGSFEFGKVSTEQLDKYLQEMLNSNVNADYNEAFNVLYRCYHVKRDDIEFTNYVIKWYLKNASKDISDISKYCIANLVWQLSSTRRNKERIIKSEDSDLLITLIQSVPMDNKGTWDRIEYYLIDRINDGEECFKKSINALLSSNESQNFINKIVNEELENLLSEIKGLSLPSRYITELISSYNQKEQEVGRVFYKNSYADVLDIELLKSLEDNRIELLILNSIRKPYTGKLTGRFYLSLEKVIRERNDKLKDLFKREMVFQGINYTDACFNTWKKEEKKSKYLNDIIKSIDQYFDKYDNASESPARNLLFQSYKDYFNKERELFSQQMQEQTKKHSVMLQLIRSIEFIYGEKSTHFIDNQIEPESEFKKFETIMEFPRMEIIDPEYMILRRLYASEIMENIRSKIDKF